jgi:ArsR family transcriptional regulator
MDAPTIDASKSIDILSTMPTMAPTLDVSRVARLFHALSDETRLGIVARLAGGERCVCELTDALDAAQSRLSFHLRTLREAGIVTARREGRWMYYALDRESLGEIEEVVGALKVHTGASGVRCC